MIVIPAIDLKDGKVVRLHQGNFDTETVYSEHPHEVALMFERDGAERIHVVDLDGAREGRLVNFQEIREIVRSVGIPVQLGGGMRTFDSVKEAIDGGVAKVIIGTGIIRDEAFVKKVIEVFGDKVIGGVDVRSGKACIEGWMKTTETPLEEVVARIVALGIGEVVYTDVTRDGTLKGPHFESILRFSRLFKGSIIISGGISSVEDVRKLRRMEQYGVKGVIIGRALYAGTIKLSEAIKAGMKGCH